MITLLDAMNDPQLFARWFRDRETWEAWRAFIAAAFALPMPPDQLAIYRQCTGRNDPPTAPASEAWLVCGRRAGKSFILALIAVFLACFHDFRRHLSPGERGTILVIASDRKQARTILRYIRALLTEVPMLARLVERETNEAFDLSNRITIEVGTASFRAVRGYTIVAALLDELAFFDTDDAADPDYEIIAALRPAMATIPNAMLLCASSPYARRGALFEAHKRHFGQNGDPILVWQADTRRMNPTVPQRIVDEAYARDPASAAAEFGAQFRSDIEAVFSREAIAACVAPSVRERPPEPGIRYAAHVDPSGGSSDAMTLAIAHREGDLAVLDCVREVRPPFAPEGVVEEFTALLKTYRITKLRGDRYAGEWPREQFRKRGVNYELSDRSASEIYQAFLPLVNSRAIVLLDNDRIASQAVALERRASRSGRDLYSHPPSGHDDLINSVAGVCVALAGQKTTRYADLNWVDGRETPKPTLAERLAALGITLETTI